MIGYRKTDQGEEYLYRQQSGEFFLEYLGTISPLSNRDARGWVRKYLRPQRYETVFGKDVWGLPRRATT